MSMKRIIREELESRGIDIFYRNVAGIKHILELVKTLEPDQVWLVHSSLVLPCDKASIKQPVVGFGFSDPHYFSPTRLKSYDIYITAHYGTYLKYRDSMPVLFSPDCYDPHSYKGLELEKTLDISCIGRAVHPQFGNTRERIETVGRLRTETNLDIHTFGNGWSPNAKNHGYIVGDELVNIINSSRIGLDIQGGRYSISERVLHYSGCGIPIITRENPEVDKMFVTGKEILTYNNYEELKEKLVYYLSIPDKLRQIGKAAQKRCIKEHTVTHRVDNILDFLKGNIK